MSDINDVTQVVLRERQARDRGWWDRMADAYWPDSQVRVSWYSGDGHGFVDRSRQMAGRGDGIVHRLSPPVLHVVGTRAWAEVAASIEARTFLDGGAADLVSFARLVYRLECRLDSWRIITLDAIYERDTFAAVAGPDVSLPATELTHFRPSYCRLAWYLSRRGYSIDGRLLGDDEPAARDAFYRSILDWLGGVQRPVP